MSVLACFVCLLVSFRLYHLPGEPVPDVYLQCPAASNPPDLTQKDSDGETGVKLMEKVIVKLWPTHC